MTSPHEQWKAANTEVILQTDTHSIIKEPGWLYGDKCPTRGRFKLAKYFSPSPHLVLRDAKGEPRFVMQFDLTFDGHLWIGAVQRLRTQYAGTGRKLQWSPEMETAASRELQQQLGRRPTEYLVNAFLHWTAPQIKKGTKVFLAVPSSKSKSPQGIIARQNALPLRERFFQHTATRNNFEGTPLHELAMKKKRVKEILGAK
ncbi:MAG: hypothetical protein V1722_04950 [Candidatus Micrarchaeota archaeon]